MANRLDLTGQWHGTFRYPRQGGPDTPFIANISERNGGIDGSLIEPNEFHSAETAVATLAGHRSGLSVDFTKIYHGAGEEYDNPVDYVGQLAIDGLSITGVWSLLDWDGTFEMFREIEAEDTVETEVQISLPVSVDTSRQPVA